MTQVKRTDQKKKVGVISTIVNLIEKSGTKGITKDQILDKLIKAFPDRNKDGMKNTIKVQVPNRISKERFKLVKSQDGYYRKAVK